MTGMDMLKASANFQAMSEEGQRRFACKAILLVGEDRLGPASEAVKAQLERVTKPYRLLRMLRRITLAVSWEVVLQTP